MFRVERVKEDDLFEIAALEQEVFSDPWSRGGLEETFRQPHAAIFGVWKEDVLAGYVILYYIMDEGEIARIAVKDCFRRQGAAGEMLLRIEEFCRESGVGKLLLEVRENNTAAVSFYKKYGFRQDGIRKKFYVNPSEDAILMSYRIMI